MNLVEALNHAHSIPLPSMFINNPSHFMGQIVQNENALFEIIHAMKVGAELPVPVNEATRDLLDLCDRNRADCDSVPEFELRKLLPKRLEWLTENDVIAGVAKLQNRRKETIHKETIERSRSAASGFSLAPMKGCVLGIDIETSSLRPERGYILNVGWELMELTPTATPFDGCTEFCNLPVCYRNRPVPLSHIHHITWQNLNGTLPFRENTALHKTLLSLFKKYPVLAHNAAFEDSWFSLHLPGYLEERLKGKIIIIDTRDICRALDSEVARMSYRDKPAALENWARRRGVLAEHENEVHQGLDDTDLMLRCVQAQLAVCDLFKEK